MVISSSVMRKSMWFSLLVMWFMFLMMKFVSLWLFMFRCCGVVLGVSIRGLFVVLVRWVRLWWFVFVVLKRW